MDAARRSGRVRVWCLGVGLDPLTLWGEILTVAVFDDEVFDELFSGLVVANDEGMVVTLGTPGRPAHGVPFVEELVAQLLGSEPMAPAAVAWLALARRHREGLLVATPGRPQMKLTQPLPFGVRPLARPAHDDYVRDTRRT